MMPFKYEREINQFRIRNTQVKMEALEEGEGLDSSVVDHLSFMPVFEGSPVYTADNKDIEIAPGLATKTSYCYYCYECQRR